MNLLNLSVDDVRHLRLRALFLRMKKAGATADEIQVAVRQMAVALRQAETNDPRPPVLHLVLDGKVACGESVEREEFVSMTTKDPCAATCRQCWGAAKVRVVG